MKLADDARYAAYLICQERGHSPSGFITAGIPPKQRCRYCDTYYWTETVNRETSAPEPPEQTP